MGKNRKLDRNTSEKWLKYHRKFVIENLEKFNLDNNKIALQLITNYDSRIFLNLKHFK
jgi:hypothetical protein